jgi:hypothetical protein
LERAGEVEEGRDKAVMGRVRRARRSFILRDL